MAALTARPASEQDLVTLLRDTAATHPAVLLTGAGTKQHLGPAPERVDLAVDTRELRGVIEYNPGDLVIRARSGTTAGELRAVVAEHGQQLALDLRDEETLGGVVAANLGGPRRRRYGTVRDLLIGVRFALADGRIANSGGRVVKNVAGYDLGKLMTGSLGTLAALLELTFRLHPGPGHRRVVEQDLEAASLAELAHWALRTQHDLAALEYRADLAGRGSVVAVVEGREPVVEATVHRLSTEWAGATARPAHPDELRVRSDLSSDEKAFPTSTFVVKIAVAPSGLPALVHQVGRLPAAGLTGEQRWQLGLGLGTVRLSGSIEDLVAALAGLRAVAHEHDGTVVVLDSPSKILSLEEIWGPMRGESLMRAVKDRFDPAGRLAPGRLVPGRLLPVTADGGTR